MDIEEDRTIVKGADSTALDELDDPWDETVNLESKFYAEGYQSGFDHGRLHGLFEGRELGQEKAWEIWEEVGFMEGFAMSWEEVLAPAQGGAEGGKGPGKGRDTRALSHARQLLALISTFPTFNPSTASASATQPDNTPGTVGPQDETSSVAGEVDLTILLSTIRARYKLLCTSLGVRPRLLTASSTAGSAAMISDADAVGGVEGIVSGIEGPMKGVDTRQLRY